MRTVFLTLVLAAVSGTAAAETVPSNVTFYKDVLPIFQENCQECHRPSGTNYGGMVAPFSLVTFEEARPWAKSIAQQVAARKMPPWHADPMHNGEFSNERVLSDLEIEIIVQWTKTGARPGNPNDAPPPRAFDNTGGWVIGEPDLILAMPEPFYVSDDVDDLYTAFTVDLTDFELPEDRWITAFQCKPGSKIIHHFNCHLLEPVDGKLPPPPNSPISKTIAPQGAGQYLGGVSSGTGANIYPEGFGLPLKRGTRVTFDIHYHKESGPGTAVTDLSHIGFKLSDEPPVRQLGGVAPLMHFNINIKPGEKDHRIGPVATTLDTDVDVISLMPHMHMRGSRAKFEAIYPDGKNEVLLYVPNYDFAWQTVYYYEEMKRLPEGTRIEYTAWYDNSPEKAAEVNFDSNQTVTFGPSSTDEMMMGFIMAAPAENSDER